MTASFNGTKITIEFNREELDSLANICHAASETYEHEKKQEASDESVQFADSFDAFLDAHLRS